jgi:hypothetical protein
MITVATTIQRPRRVLTERQLVHPTAVKVAA